MYQGVNPFRVRNKIKRRTESGRFGVWQGRRIRPSEDGRWSLTPFQTQNKPFECRVISLGALSFFWNE